MSEYQQYEEERIMVLQSPPSVKSNPAPEGDLSDWVKDYGNRLFAYALLRVKNNQVAEDLVQDTFLSAVKNVESFEGRSSPYTWLYAILKNKIIDHLRKESRYVSEEFSDDSTDWQDGIFTKFGLWNMSFSDWNEQPDDLLDRKQFREIFDECLMELPAKHRQAFVLKVIDQVPTDEVCELMNISANNLWVILYRARMGLRKLIDEKWFKADKR
jgi:RNA polymerase sigma-70 factor (ECF subfamily)